MLCSVVNIKMDCKILAPDWHLCTEQDQKTSMIYDFFVVVLGAPDANALFVFRST